jgi:hypothetical protein
MNKQSAAHKLASVFEARGLRAKGGEGRDLKDFAIGPYVHVDNDHQKQMWGSRRKVVRWLERYYCHDRRVDLGARLILKRLGRFGSFLVINQDADILDLLSRTERTNKLQKHRREFRRFSDYLSGKDVLHRLNGQHKR